jgi:parallel beta-helix repeat protein
MTDPTTARPGPRRYNSVDARDVRPKQRSFARRAFGLSLGLAAFGIMAGGVTAGVVVWQMDQTPREWANRLLRPDIAEQPLLGSAAGLAASLLNQADRLVPAKTATLPGSLGASAERSGTVPDGRLRPVSSLQELRDAAGDALPGDVIQIQPGLYHFTGSAIHLNRPGTAAAPIVVRAARLGDVVIESDGVETLKVSAPFWRFENLSMRGVCADHSECEHAFHVVAGGGNAVIRNNLLVDYNAHIKINGEDGLFPDHGLVEGNTMTDTAPRVTANPIAPVDLVAANEWVIRGNIIADFIRAPGQGGEPPYGGFVKGEGEGNVLERNLVVCEWTLRGIPGERVGLSLGGGSTGMPFRRMKGLSGFEQVGGVVRDNLVASCSDDGIYVNRSARSVIDHNTLLDTAGIDVRFIESSATVTANIVDGAIRKRDASSLQSRDNAMPFLPELFVGLHPQRGFFRDPAALDLAWDRQPAGLADAARRVDLCGRQRPANAPPGAFGDFGDCLAGQ